MSSPSQQVIEAWRSGDVTIEAEVALAEAGVALWQWTTPDPARVSPFQFVRERQGIPVARVLAGPPEGLSDVDSYGFDRGGRLRVARQRASLGGQEWVTVRQWHPTEMVQIQTERSTGLIRAGRQELEDGRVLLAEEFGGRPGAIKWVTERYIWSGKRLIEVARATDDEEGAPEERSRLRSGTIEAFEYDDRGALVRIRGSWRDDGGEFGVLEIEPDARAVRRALSSYMESLRTWLDVFSDEDRLVVALVYDAEDPIPVAAHALRPQQWHELSELSLTARADPANWSGPPLEMPRNVSCVDVLGLSHQVRRHDLQADTVNLLNRLAKAMNRGAEHRLVYAVDREGLQLEENLEAALGKSGLDLIAALWVT